MDDFLPCVELEPDRPARATVLWLHGLGADGHDFEPIVPALGLDPALAVRFVFPHAPAIPVTLNGGMRMPAWYDISVIDLRTEHDEAGILRSAEQIRALLRREHERGVPAERIVLAGFSQGGAIALHTGLRYPQRLAGILALSTYLVLPERLATERSQPNREVPILQAHGSHDPMVVLQRGLETRNRLVELGYAVTWHDYPMQHEVCLDEIHDVGAWLGQRLCGR